MRKAQIKIDTKIGSLFLVASENGLQGVYWRKQKCSEPEDLKSPEARLLKKAESEIHEYLEGKRRSFDLPLDAEGTAFQKRVWAELAKIPYGKTKSYKDIALDLKSAGSSRAVGTANGKNPLNLVVPCHRVIASNGSLGGYSGGLELKKRLLALEQAGVLPSE